MEFKTPEVNLATQALKNPAFGNQRPNLYGHFT